MSTVSRRSPLSGGRLGEPGAQVGLHVDLARRLDQQAPAVAAADDGERRLGRAQHLDACPSGGARRATSRAKSCASLLVARRRRPAPRAGRTAAAGRLALGDLALQERLAVAGDDGLHHRMLGHVGLHEAAAQRRARGRRGPSPDAGAGTCARRRADRRPAPAPDRRRRCRRSRAAGSGGPWPPSACR